MQESVLQHYQLESFNWKHGSAPTWAQLAYLDINPTAQKVALVLTCFRGRLSSTLNFSSGALKGHRVIVLALFGNGESSSPSNMVEPMPPLTYQDCVRAQHQLVSQHLAIEAIDVVIGFSMGGQCAYHWSIMYPDMAHNAVIICSSARTSRHNYQFLEGPKAALEYSADYGSKCGEEASPKPMGGLRAFGKAYSAWLTSPEWFEKEMYQALGYETLEDWDKDAAGTNYYSWHPDDLLAMIGMWQRGDVSSIFGDSSLSAALSRIKARVLLMPCSTDQYFGWKASETESSAISDATLKVIPSAWGHMAGLGYNPSDKAFMDQAIGEFLSGNPESLGRMV